MAICNYCGCEFNLTHAKRVIGRKFGKGIYDLNFPDGDVCEDCASVEVGTYFDAGAEILEYSPDILDD